jgi:hypothetical protein
VLALRVLVPGHDTLALALAELGLYLAVTAVATWYLESSLLREAVDHVLGRAAAVPAV